VDVIDALYAASEAGVDIHLRIRGICCLRPGIPGLSSRIRVHTIIDRFLEHVRLFRFENGGAPEYYFSSADWMPRNFHRRVEVLTPVLDPRMQREVELIREISFADVAKSWELLADGTYERLPGSLPTGAARSVDVAADGSGTASVRPSAGPQRSQQRFMDRAKERSKKGDPIARPSAVLGLESPVTEAERKIRRAKERQRKKQGG
jgi:polyphosphate kinase